MQIAITKANRLNCNFKISMKVSAIIPNYNHGGFLKQRIDSVLGQTYTDIEVIILDDVSTDNSREIIEQYRGNPKVTAIDYNETNSGSPFKQWQKGMALAKGEIIWMAESDDWCEPNFLEVLVEGLTKNQGCVLAYAQTCCIDANNHIRYITKATNLEEVVNGNNFINWHLTKGTIIVNASMAIFKKEVFEKMPDDFTQLKFSGDWLFWIEAARLGNVFISGRVLNFFRKHDKDVSGKAYASGYNFIENLTILQYLKKYGLITEGFFRQLVFIKYATFRQQVKKYTPEAVQQIKNRFWGMFPSNLEARKYFFVMQVKSSLKVSTGKKN